MNDDMIDYVLARNRFPSDRDGSSYWAMAYPNWPTQIYFWGTLAVGCKYNVDVCQVDASQELWESHVGFPHVIQPNAHAVRSAYTSWRRQWSSWNVKYPTTPHNSG